MGNQVQVERAVTTGCDDGLALGASQRLSYVVKTACRRILETVGWLHGQGVVHRSLGSSSLLLSTYDQSASPQQLQVKAIDLGFATTAARIAPSAVASAMARGASSPLDVIPFLARADDLHALAYVLLELVLGAAASAADDGDGGGRPVDLQALKRLVEDVFAGDVCGDFREHCASEPEWAAGVELLDEAGGAGWELIQELVDCRDAKAAAASGVSCASALESRWFKE